MRRVIVFVGIFLMAFMPGVKSKPVYSGHGIDFVHLSLAEAFSLAKEQHKLIFIDIYATWCSPCRLLKVKTFPNKDAGEFFNTNFVNLSFNGEEGEGLKLVQDYRLNAFPTLIIFNSDGTLLLSTEGYMDAKTLIEFGKEGMEKRRK